MQKNNYLVIHPYMDKQAIKYVFLENI